MPAHDDTIPTPTNTVASLRREVERNADRVDAIRQSMGGFMDHLHTIPPAMVGAGDAARETANRMRDLAPNLEVILPRSPDFDRVFPPMREGELSLMGGYSGVGRSMFGGVPIHQSDAVPEGTAYLVDRSALQFNPREGLQLDRAGSSLGITRAPDEGDDNYRERIDMTARPSIFTRMFNNLRRQNGRGESTPEPTAPWYDCYMCGVRGTPGDLDLSTDAIMSSGMCGPCYGVSGRSTLPPREPRGHCERCSIPSRNRFCDPCQSYRNAAELAQRDTRDDDMFGQFTEQQVANHRDVEKFLGDFLESVENPNGPTIKELEATYRV